MRVRVFLCLQHSNIVPLLIAHVHKENAESWRFAFDGLLEVYGATAFFDKSNVLGLITDRHAGLRNAARDAFAEHPNVHITNCVQHVQVIVTCPSCTYLTTFSAVDSECLPTPW